MEQFYASIPLPDPSRCIRLLDLYPATRLESDCTLIGHVRAVRLDSNPSFAALSYVWGPKAGTIVCTPQEFNLEIPKNCYSALWHLRKRFGAITIWVDSICINQSDKNEKAAQIPLMNSIYAGSERLYVWLGPANDASDRAMDYLKQYAKLRARLPFTLLMSRTWPQGNSQMFLHMWWARLRTLKEAPARLRLFLMHRWMVRGVRVDELFSRDWIQRVWTFQEIILSPNPVIVCGDKLLAWEDLTTYVLHVDEYEYPQGSYIDILGSIPRPSAPTFQSWRSTVILWLTFSRYPLQHGDQGGLIIANNYSRLLALDRANQIVRGLKFVLGCLLTPLVVILYFVGCGYLMSAIASAISGLTKSWILMLVEVILFLATLGHQGFLIGCVQGMFWHVFFGSRQNWVAKNEKGSPTEIVYLEGVRVALRERAASEPHDNVFSMQAILETLGLGPVEVDYRQSLGECFKQFFMSIVDLHPPALMMLCDAGILEDDAEPWMGPSWVPNWKAPHPSPGISSIFTVPRFPRRGDTTFSTGDIYQVKGNSLDIVQCKFIGRIKFEGRYHSGTISGAPNTGNRPHPLLGVCMWYHFIRRNPVYFFPARRWIWRYPQSEFEQRYCDSTIFATLEGIPPKWRDIVYKQNVPGSRPRATRKRERKPHEAPYDFSDRVDHFDDFLEFKSELEEIYLSRIRLEEEDLPTIRQKIDGNVQAARYSQRITDLLTKGNRAFIAVSDGFDAATVQWSIWHWIGTGPLATKVGDCVFQLPRVPGCMVLRPTTKDGEYRVVGCALIPTLPKELPTQTITLI